MIAQVTDCADSIGAVRMRRPLSRRSSWKVLTARAMLPRPVGLAEDEANRLPVVDRGALVVDEAALEADPLHGVEVEVGLELRCLLGPGDPEPVHRRKRPLQPGEAPLELVDARREIDEDVGPGLRAELPGQLNQGAATPGTRPPPRTRSRQPERARRPRGSGR